MEMMVVPTAPASPDFHFISNSSVNSPYATAPSSPKPFGNPDEYLYCYTSAPASPTRASSAIYSYVARDDWGKPATPRFGNGFDFSVGRRDGRGRQESVGTADELFDKGRIRPLKPLPPPPPRQPPHQSSGDATERSGRERSPAPTPSVASSSSGSNRRGARSLSPLRGGGGVPFDGKPPASSSPSAAGAPGNPSAGGRSGSRKWRLKDLLLFRSASEGRATGGSKDPLRKYTLLSASFNRKRSDPGNSKSGSGSFGRATASAHELHYTANRAAAEEQKRKTALPYRRNTFFGCLHFNPAVQSLARGFGGNSFNRGGSGRS